MTKGKTDGRNVRPKYVNAMIGLSIAMAFPAQADEVTELKAQMNKLLQKIEALETRQNATAEKQAATEAKIATSSAPTSRTPGTFQIPGTETTVKVGGFIQLEATKDIKNTFGGQTYDVFVPFTAANGGIPYKGTVQANRESGQTQFEARTSRVNLDINTPTAWGNLRTFVETDFLGTGGTKFQSNSTAFRLRHAYAELGPWLVGQAWTNQGDIAQGLNWFDIIGQPVGIPGMGRFPQIRYTYAINPTSKVSVSLEQPIQDYSGSDVVTFGATGTTISKNSVDTVPDFTARYTLADTWGRQSVGLILRRIKAEGTNTQSLTAAGSPEIHSSSVTGYLVNYQGQINLFKTDKLLYSLIYEDGAGRYMNDLQTSAIMTSTGLDTVKGWGANVGYQHFWKPDLQTNVSYGKVHYSTSDWTKVSADKFARYNSADSFHLNLMWSPVKDSLVGIEYVYGKIGNDVGNKGDAQRLTLGARYGF
ncbi:MAG: hypothetical protein CVU32_00580 [Betaproteobacteria bacterium HGW-Betaproteobacteria-5]|jgi:hypothetical protein|nr:MAG: hypothetical protein CVU32_00580 [Betaproteobacteria bacterium HGW-Betaproteobacteria-5]PKO41150.1 MAG: hypothetical protein CVU33_01165 [Betaproteobacteria bacterium HGW-Betaproteobacteria-6]